MKRRLFRTLRPHPTCKLKGEKKKINTKKYKEKECIMRQSFSRSFRLSDPADQMGGKKKKLTGWRRASFTVAIVDALFRHIVILKVGQIVADARQQVGRRGGDSRRRQMSQMDAVRGRRAGRMGATTTRR